MRLLPIRRRPPGRTSQENQVHAGRRRQPPLNPQDAKSLGISDGDRVRVISSSGSLEIEAFASPSIRWGVVMIHQFWGHTYESGMQTSRKHPGVNVNLLHDDQVRDRFTGMPAFNGTPCRVERLGLRMGPGDESP
jgi:formate dehydrogenase